MMKRVLITSMGSTASQNLARFLDSKYWEIWGADQRDYHGGLGICEHNVQVPNADDSGYWSALKQLMTVHEIDLVVPVMEPELRVACRQATDGSSSILVSSEECIAVCRSKLVLEQRLLAAGFRVPRRIEESNLVFPAFGRLNQGSGSRFAQRIDNTQEYLSFKTRHQDVVLNEFVDGEEISVDFFADAAHGVVHKVARLRQDVRSGLAVQSEVIEFPAELEKPLTLLSRNLAMKGFANLQLIQYEGTWLAHDLNPRLGGAMFLSFAAGLDPNQLLECWLEGKSYPQLGTRVGLQMYRRWENVILGSR